MGFGLYVHKGLAAQKHSFRKVHNFKLELLGTHGAFQLGSAANVICHGVNIATLQ